MNKKITAIFTILFLIGIVATAFTLFTIKDDLAYYNKSVTPIDFNSLMPVFTKLYIIVGATISFGLIAIFLTSKARGSAKEKVIYVDNTSAKKASEDDTTDGTDTNETKDEQASLKFLDEIISSTKDKKILYNKILSAICTRLEAGQGAVYLSDTTEEKRMVTLTASYAMAIAESETLAFEYGEGLVGQAAKEGKLLNIDNVPENYIQVTSGLGSGTPKYLLILPIKEEEEVFGVVEIAGFKPFSKNDEVLLESAFSKISNTSRKGTKKEETKDT